MRDKHQNIEEPCEKKFSRTVLKTSGTGDSLAEFNHLTETHDIWHVVINADTSMAGEIQLQAFVAAQLQISRFSLAMLAKNLLKTAVEDLDLAEQHMDALTTGWLMGKQAEPLFGIQWNTLWEKPLAQLQTQWNILLDIPTTLGPARSTSNNSRNYVNFFEVST